MQPSSQDHGMPARTFTGATDPALDAEAIFAVANGTLSLRREPQFGAAVQFGATCALPIASTAIAAYRPKQPHRHRFDAADIFELSRVSHPWQAKPIEKEEVTPETQPTSQAKAG